MGESMSMWVYVCMYAEEGKEMKVRNAASNHLPVQTRTVTVGTGREEHINIRNSSLLRGGMNLD